MFFDMSPPSVTVDINVLSSVDDVYRRLVEGTPEVDWGAKVRVVSDGAEGITIYFGGYLLSDRSITVSAMYSDMQWTFYSHDFDAKARTVLDPHEGLALLRDELITVARDAHTKSLALLATFGAPVESEPDGEE
jgi:hypothetical protein